MMNQIDDPSLQDNRKYDYTGFEKSARDEYRVIASMIDENSKVIDLGCGNGSLLELLRDEKNAETSGMEISDSAVAICREKKLNVTKGPIDSALPFGDNSFDYAVCNVTIQMVNYPEVLLKEMKRISKNQVITFPNFAYYKNRLDLLFNGRMPGKMLFGYKWYNTGHIHQLSVKDFKDLVGNTGGLEIVSEAGLPSGSPLLDFLMKIMPGLFTHIAIFKTTKC